MQCVHLLRVQAVCRVACVCDDEHPGTTEYTIKLTVDLNVQFMDLARAKTIRDAFYVFGDTRYLKYVLYI